MPKVQSSAQSSRPALRRNQARPTASNSHPPDISHLSVRPGLSFLSEKKTRAWNFFHLLGVHLITPYPKKCDAGRPHCTTCVKYVRPSPIRRSVVSFSRCVLLRRQWKATISVPPPVGFVSVSHLPFRLDDSSLTQSVVIPRSRSVHMTLSMVSPSHPIPNP